MSSETHLEVKILEKVIADGNHLQKLSRCTRAMFRVNNNSVNVNKWMALYTSVAFFPTKASFCTLVRKNHDESSLNI